MIDHLFRHQYGKMVSILTRIFGLTQLEIIEDAVQDTFAKAVLSWRHQVPENPEAWLTKAAKNRIIDLFRQLNAEKQRVPKIDYGPSSISINKLFLESEIEDSQLRMIFTACHPALNAKDQIAFALKTISGFNGKEIASALLLKEETIKKRLSRARKAIKAQTISFEIPQGKELPLRLDRVLEVLYLIFNEGFHSNKKDILIRQDLCAEALRLTKMLLKNEFTKKPPAYALFALMCFHAARLKSKINEQQEIIDLKNQDRTLWYPPLVAMGNQAMTAAVQTSTFSCYHYEAAIAAEHLQASSFATTNWDKIQMWYQQLYKLQASPFILLNMAVVELQRGAPEKAKQLLENINPHELEQRAYLYYGTWSEYYTTINQTAQAIESIDTALKLVTNNAERDYLFKKKALIA